MAFNQVNTVCIFECIQLNGPIVCVTFVGFLTVTGRIKELLITKGGENVAPIPLESVSAYIYIR